MFVFLPVEGTDAGAGLGSEQDLGPLIYSPFGIGLVPLDAISKHS